MADRVPVAKLEKLFGGREFFIETKYDGERCQVHLLKGSIHVVLYILLGFMLWLDIEKPSNIVMF